MPHMGNRGVRSGLAFAAAVAALLGGLPAAASAATFTVTVAGDTTGTTCSAPSCSLRQAIGAANLSSGADTIVFSGVTSISPTLALPPITGRTTISAAPPVAIDGGVAGAGADGLSFSGFGASNSVIEGVAISHFTRDGIRISGATAVTVRSSRIGTDPAGATGFGNAGNGISLLNGASTAQIGVGFTFPLGNTIVGNLGDAIHADATSGSATIVGNSIGFDPQVPAANGNGGDAIDLASPSNVIGGIGTGEGNVIANSAGAGVRITGAGASANRLQGNFVGVTSFDALAGNAGRGVLIDGAPGNHIGGSGAGEGNTISGNGRDGIEIVSGASGNEVDGNRIGTNTAGDRLRPNGGNGVSVNSSPNTTIGGSASGAGNLISGNLGNGIDVENTPSANTVIQGNRIGTNAAGTAALPNVSGIAAESTTLVGGANPGEGNLISGNLDTGIILGNVGPGRVQGNLVGTNAAGTGAVPNGAEGIDIDQPGASVGGPGSAGNTVAFNLGAGIRVGKTGVVVAENSVLANGGLGIDLDPVGLTPNDPGDADTGRQNFPDLSAAVAVGGATIARGAVATAPGRTLTLRFAASPACDPSGFGEGATPLGSATVTADAAGNAAFEVSLPFASAPGQQLTATATGPEGTSEFSACRAVQAAGTLAFSAARVTAAEGGRATLTVVRSGAGGVTSHVRVATVGGTATAGRDFAASSATVTFAPGETAKAITVPIAKDTAAEGDERFTVALSAPDGGALGAPATATVLIPGNGRGPDSGIDPPARRAVPGASLRSIRGAADDPDGDLARVEVAIVGARGGARLARRACLSVGAGGRVSTTLPDRRGRCRPRRFVRASGTARWTLTLARALPRGTWVVFSRAVDRAGHRETTFSARDGNRAVLRIA